MMVVLSAFPAINGTKADLLARIANNMRVMVMAESVEFSEPGYGLL